MGRILSNLYGRILCNIHLGTFWRYEVVHDHFLLSSYLLGRQQPMDHTESFRLLALFHVVFHSSHQVHTICVLEECLNTYYVLLVFRHLPLELKCKHSYHLYFIHLLSYYHLRQLSSSYLYIFSVILTFFYFYSLNLNYHLIFRFFILIHYDCFLFLLILNFYLLRIQNFCLFKIRNYFYLKSFYFYYFIL